MNVILPELAEGVSEAAVSFWHVEPGQQVNEGEDLVEMTTDKAVFNVPSPASGTLKEIKFEEGETIRVGDTIAVIE